MPKKVIVEGRTITVPDDATPDEIDQIANPNSSVSSRSPVPKTQESGSKLTELVSNLPGSFRNVLKSPMGPGSPAPGAQENFPKGTYPEQFQDVLPRWKQGVSDFIHHPIDTITNAVIKHPVESALTVAAGGRGAFPEEAAIVPNAVSNVYRETKAAAPDIANSAWRGAKIGGIGGELFGGKWAEGAGVGGTLAAAPTIVKAVGKGLGKTIQDYKVAKRVGSGAERVPTNIEKQPEGPAPVEQGPINKPTLPSGKQPGPAQVREVQRNTKIIEPQPNMPNTEIRPMSKPELPSGRKVGGIQNQEENMQQESSSNEESSRATKLADITKRHPIYANEPNPTAAFEKDTNVVKALRVNKDLGIKTGQDLKNLDPNTLDAAIREIKNPTTGKSAHPRGLTPTMQKRIPYIADKFDEFSQ